MERLILFAKSPRLYQVKTRLAPRLTPEQALGLHEAMLTDQLRFVRSLESGERGGELCVDGAFAGNAEGLPCTSQGDGDLGARMHRALGRAFSQGVFRAAILGSDAPTLPRALVEDAFGVLRGAADAVIIPALDGGYVFVGASRPVPALFQGVPWGTASVLETTRRIAREAGLKLWETPPWPDVDVEADLPGLAKGLTADPARAPATTAFMKSLMLV